MYNYTYGFREDPLPKTEKEARECWEQMSDEMSPDFMVTWTTYRAVLRDALRLHKKFPHPKDINLEALGERARDKDVRLFGYKDCVDYFDTWKKAKGY